jgi:two-component system, response regulator PdtaR
VSPDAELCPTPGHVLIVEDDVLIRALLADELRDAGLRVIEAANADEALAIFEAGAQVDLLFTDIQMPGSMNGVELAQRIKDIEPALPIILTSGNAGTSAAHLGSFIPKPYDVDRAVAIVLQFLGFEPRGSRW